MRITNPLTQTKKKRLPQPPRPLCKTRPCTRFTANTGTSRSCFPPYLSFHRSHPVISRPTSVSSVFTGWVIFTSVLSRSALIFHIVLHLRWCLYVPHSYEGDSPINICFMCQLNSVLYCNISDENEDCHHLFSCFYFSFLCKGCI